MSKIGQHVQDLQQGQPEPLEPDPLYDGRKEIETFIINDPGYFEYLLKELYGQTTRRN